MATDPPEDLPPEEVKKLSGLVPDLVRRAVLTGVGALFMTEEGLRNMVGEMKLPKDALGFLVAQAEKTRGEVTRVVTHEVRRFLESETLRRELWKVLTGVTVEVNATISLKPSGEPQIKGKIKTRQKGEPEETKSDGEKKPDGGRKPDGGKRAPEPDGDDEPA